MKRLAALCASMAVVGLTLAAGPAGATVAHGSGHEAGHPISARTWTVTPGGASSAKSGTVTIADTTTGAKITCKQSASTDTFKSGSGLSGHHIAKITKISYTTCSLPAKPAPKPVQATVKPSGMPELNTVKPSGAPGRPTGSSGGATGTITGIGLKVSGAGCSASVTGPGTATTGRVTFSYANATGRLTVETANSTLHMANVSGCFGLFNDGDPVTISTTYTLTPIQTITSP